MSDTDRLMAEDQGNQFRKEYQQTPAQFDEGREPDYRHDVEYCPECGEPMVHECYYCKKIHRRGRNNRNVKRSRKRFPERM